MKFKIKPLVSFLLITALVFSSAFLNTQASNNNENDAKVPESLSDYQISAAEMTAVQNGFSPVLKNNGYTLFYKPSSAEIAVFNRSGNEMVYSNPQDISPEATGLSVNRMKSQLYVTYYTNNTQAKYYSSYYDSVSYGQADAQIKKNSLIVEYTFGKESFTKEMLPIAIPKEKFEKKILPALSKEDRETVEYSYELVSIKDAKTEVARNKLIERYKNIEDTDLYALDRYIADYDVEAVYKALFSCYTNEDFLEDNKAAGGETDVVNTSITFTLSLVYSLKDYGLSVKLDCSKLKSNETADIDSVTVLEFFGCGGKGDTGYSLIPDGSGGIINFNSNKEWANAYSARIYGNDSALGYTNASNTPNILLPVFAIAKGNSGILALANNGASLCNIVSDIANEAIPYNTTAFCANVFAYDKMSVLNPEYGGGTSEIFVRENTPYNSTLDFEYYFLTAGKNSYADIASLYRGILLKNKVISKKVSGDIPFVFGLVGAVDVKKQFLGIPYVGYEVLTSFKQASKIIDSFSECGINNMQVRYLGWFNGGMSQTDVSKMKVLSCLGGKKGLKKLIESSKANIYPEINVCKVSNKLFDGFSVKNDAVRFTYNEAALMYPISLSQNNFDYEGRFNYLLSPSKFEDRIQKFANKYTYGNIAISDLASELYSDFSKDNFTNRITAQQNAVKAIDSLSENNIMLSAPNSYALGYADILIDMPLGTANANIFDLQIPFIQMVLGGYADMACEPINISDNRDDILSLIAFNTLPNYTFMYAEASVLKDTDYTEFYSLNYKDWQNEASELYFAYIKDMQKVRGCVITDWTLLASDVIKISYENGAVIVVNKSEKDFILAGKLIKASDYSFFEEGLN